ncbi:hypothetical protein HUJ04_013373 [Dendroctonus ponderosae]|uniref:Rho-GAP domain-containing protein n=1 Tax=Dendroctonus ponderosae TaxID=77166 RepID=A0AAR5Q2M3_DENPD|nr:hypothetical protein HUJ04_013373 [Dendroctonus ponderosae]
MFINDVNRKEEIRSIAVQHLRKYGIKYRPKKQRPVTQAQICGKKLFKVPLDGLATETVTLPNGQQLIVPKRLQEMCTYILSKVQTEGIFRKEGSKARQHEIKLSLDRGHPLGVEHHVIDVAAVLKCFLRELPEPLIAPALNDLFLMCSLDKRPKRDVIECLLLSCLLLPSKNLNVLSYLMQFFNEVASFSLHNKMNFSNLSILVGPNIFPIDEKVAPKSSLTITRICEITRLLIENSKSIGVIPEYIMEQIGQLSDLESEKRRKIKRRSGSLTRMLNGLKKIVSSKTEEVGRQPATPDVLLTPSIHASMKKKKGDSGLSLKRKKEVLRKLPDCALLNTPFTPSKTPVCANPNGKKTTNEHESVPDLAKEKKMHWYMRSRSMKNLKEEDANASSSNSARRNSIGPKTLLERRWSAVSNAAAFRKKKRHSCAAPKVDQVSSIPSHPEDPEYVRVSKTEYEEFKNRVSAIERRISIELDNVQSHMQNDNNVNCEIDTNIDNVQSAYEKTLETASLSPSTDQLARRLSRDLKIRRSAEQKIIRSPSARKIGTLRRRSTEREKKNVQAQVGRPQTSQAPLLPRVSTRRPKKPQHESFDSVETAPLTNGVQRSISFPKTSRPTAAEISGKRSSLTNTSFVHPSPLEMCSSRNASGTSQEQWVSAEGYFGVTPQEESSGTSRASIAKLRSQNLGMVRAKARLFDHLQDVDTSGQAGQSSEKTPLKTPSADGSRKSYRIKCMRAEERRRKKGSTSPRRRQAVLSQKQKLQSIGRQYAARCNSSTQDSLDLSTPRKDLNSLDAAVLSPRLKVPYIKGPLALKTPKRLCRTPAVDRRTPFKALATPL